VHHLLSGDTQQCCVIKIGEKRTGEVMPTATMDFYSDWIAILRAELASVRYPAPAVTDPQEVCFRYFNYRKRSVDVRPRTVEQSAEFSVPADCTTGYAALKTMIEAGADLTPHLSTHLTDPDYDDPMLNDWGIHHFHLGTTPHPTRHGFVARTGPLLYGCVMDDRFLCLQIMAHSNWTNPQLIEIWHNNWPQMLEPYKLKGFSASTPPVTDTELNQLRRGRVNTLQQLPDGSLIAPPGGGVSASGLSAQVVRDCDWYAHQMKTLEKHVQNKLGDLVAAAQADGVTLPDQCVFKLHVSDGRFVAVEQSVNWGAIVLTLPQ
jgi:hypothetical protein